MAITSSGFISLAAAPALADTKGCTVYSAVTVAGVPLPAGTYCATIVGSGKWVDGVQGEFYAPNLCNWDVTAEFFDNHWNWKKTYVSRHVDGCNYGSAWAPYINVNANIDQLANTESGYMCSTLRAGWQRVTSACNYIH